MWGVAGLTVAFVILAMVLLWVLITSRTHVVIKIFLISFVLWYGAVLYYTPDNLMGWARSIYSKDYLPDKSWVQNVIIKEPNKKTKEPGYIYFLVIVYQIENKTSLTLDPRSTFTYKGDKEPRLYKVEYSRKLHKEIIRVQKDRKKAGKGSVIFVGKKKKGDEGNSGDGSPAKLQFKIINPVDLIIKESP